MQDLVELRKMVEAKEAEAEELRKLDEEKRASLAFAENRSHITRFGKDLNMSDEIRNNLITMLENRDARPVELRADEGLKINSTGKDYYASMVEKFRIAKPLSSRASYLRGLFSGFQIPLITARPAVNVQSTEGDTAVSVDSQMAISRKYITPSLYGAVLGISYQTGKWSQITDAEIEDAFAESFGETIENALQSRNAGSSYPISGLLSKDTSVCASGNTVTAGQASACKWADILALAEKAVGKMGKWQLVVPAGVISGLIAENTQDYNFCKEELLRNHSIRGIEVVEIATAISHTAGDVYATLIDLEKNMKVCVAADDVILDRVRDKNSFNTYLQGAMGIAAAVVLPSEVYQLVAHS